MTNDYRDQYAFKQSPMQDDVLRAQLQQAILADDAERFRTFLRENVPQLVDEARLYGILVPTAGGKQTIMVDRTGRRLGSEDILDAEIPIDMLNVTYSATEMTVTFENQKWTRPYES